MFSRQFDRRTYLLLGVLFFALALGFSFGVYALWPANREQGYQPIQPILYSHLTHAGNLQMECLYCHYNTERAAVANLPSVEICMNCHRQVQPRNALGQVNQDIARLVKHWQESEPIAWEQVHVLADFVYFDHSRHMKAGRTCQECHGPIERMERVYRFYAMKMDWCLECHRREPPEGFRDGRKQWASDTCNTCHR